MGTVSRPCGGRPCALPDDSLDRGARNVWLIHLHTGLKDMRNADLDTGRPACQIHQKLSPDKLSMGHVCSVCACVWGGLGHWGGQRQRGNSLFPRQVYGYKSVIIVDMQFLGMAEPSPEFDGMGGAHGNNMPQVNRVVDLKHKRGGEGSFSFRTWEGGREGGREGERDGNIAISLPAGHGYQSWKSLQRCLLTC